MVVLIFLAFIVACITVDVIVQHLKQKNESASSVASFSPRTFSETSVSAPRGLYYGKTHSWAFMEKNGVVKIGVDDFLLHIMGPISGLKLKNVGTKIIKGEPAFTIIQNGKQLIINSPISGTVKAQNVLVTEDSTTVNSSPYHDGWIYMIEPSGWVKEIQQLIMADKYKEWLKNEFTRLKDFLATATRNKNLEMAPVAYQDGGELRDNILKDLEPKVWEDFQVNFINAPQ